jgi:phosphoglycolate phosphatase-like HAD superfamily hydrolase
MVRIRRPRAVILDHDGTLVDSNDSHARAWLDAFREAGFTDVTLDLVRPLIGMGPAASCRARSASRMIVSLGTEFSTAGRTFSARTICPGSPRWWERARCSLA